MSSIGKCFMKEPPSKVGYRTKENDRKSCFETYVGMSGGGSPPPDRPGGGGGPLPGGAEGAARGGCGGCRVTGGGLRRGPLGDDEGLDLKHYSC